MKAMKTYHNYMMAMKTYHNYSQACLFGTQENCPYPYFRGSLIRIYIIVGPLLTVLIIEMSLFQSVHNSRFDCMPKTFALGRP